MSLSDCQKFLAYCRSLSRDGRVAQKSDIRPAQLAPMLPKIFIVERERDGAFRFRLVGTGLTELLGRELNGADAIALQMEEHRPIMKRAMEGMLTGHRGVLARQTIFLCDERTVELRHVAAPFADNAGDVRFIAGLTEVMDKRVYYSKKDQREARHARRFLYRLLDLGLPPSAEYREVGAGKCRAARV